MLFAIIGILSHHLAHDKFELFSQGLKNVTPILNQLTRSRRSRIVWMLQPLGPFTGNLNFTAQIPYYNKEAKSILK